MPFLLVGRSCAPDDPHVVVDYAHLHVSVTLFWILDQPHVCQCTITVTENKQILVTVLITEHLQELNLLLLKPKYSTNSADKCL